MLKLKGNAAAVMAVAKNQPTLVGATTLERMQVAIAVTAGLARPDSVRPGDVLRIVAELHDAMSAAGLLHKPAVSILEALRHYWFAPPEVSMPTALLEAMVSNLTLTRMVDDDGIRLFDWRGGLPADFESQARALYESASEAAVPA